MTNKALYVQRILATYHKIPGALLCTPRDDLRTAGSLHDRGIDLETVRHAFVLAVARRSFGSVTKPSAIRTLRYFLPVIQELVQAPPDPGYLEYLDLCLREIGLEL